MWGRRRRSDEDFAQEVRAHLEIEADRLIAEGCDPADRALTIEAAQQPPSGCAAGNATALKLLRMASAETERVQHKETPDG